jgi:hypothetical protein
LAGRGGSSLLSTRNVTTGARKSFSLETVSICHLPAQSL